MLEGGETGEVELQYQSDIVSISGKRGGDLEVGYSGGVGATTDRDS